MPLPVPVHFTPLRSNRKKGREGGRGERRRGSISVHAEQIKPEKRPVRYWEIEEKNCENSVDQRQRK